MNLVSTEFVTDFCSAMFIDRLETQKEISVLVANVFGDKKKVSYEDYANINENVTSEMFLSIMTLLQSNLPCSANYFRYKANFEEYLDGG